MPGGWGLCKDRRDGAKREIGVSSYFFREVHVKKELTPISEEA
jgi:hypothetical protein